MLCDVQSRDQEESKLNSTINVNSGAHTLTHDLILKIKDVGAHTLTHDLILKIKDVFQ